MRLVDLTIISKKIGKVINYAKFNEFGLSIICDDDNLPSTTGSSIGKTAFVRCIDICLGAQSEKVLYENNIIGLNKKLKEYIFEYELSAILRIKNNLGVVTKLERNLYKGYQFINDEQYDNIIDYRNRLANIFFDDFPDNLTFRQVLPKFLRINTGEKVLKYFDVGIKNIIYRYAYTYLLGLFVNENEIDLSNELNDYKKKITSYKKEYGIKDIIDFGNLIKQKKLEVDKAKNEIISNDYLSDFKSTEESNENISNQLDLLEISYYEKKHRLDILKRNIQKESKKIFNQDITVLKLLYDESIQLFHNTNVKFEELLKFHNDMCNIRKNNYQQEVNKLEKEIAIDEIDVKNLRAEFSAKFVNYKTNLNEKSGSLYDSYNLLRNDYDRIEQDFNNFKNVSKKINDIQINVRNIEKKIENNQRIIDSFNVIFNANSSRMLGQNLSIKYVESLTKFPITIVGDIGPLGAGDSNILTAAIDFSFYDYFVNQDIERPYFQIHDRVETTPKEDLRKIFEKVRECGIQYIVPVLHDRIEDLDVKDEEVILHLSKNNKLLGLN